MHGSSCLGWKQWEYKINARMAVWMLCCCFALYLFCLFNIYSCSINGPEFGKKSKYFKWATRHQELFEKSEKEPRLSLKVHKVCNHTDAHKCSLVQTLQQARMFASLLYTQTDPFTDLTSFLSIKHKRLLLYTGKWSHSDTMTVPWISSYSWQTDNSRLKCAPETQK